MAKSPSVFDKRVIQRSIAKGLLGAGEYQRMLDELPDLSHNVAESEPAAPPESARAEQTAETSGAAERQLRTAGSEGLSGQGASDEPLQARPLLSPEAVGEPPAEELLQTQAPAQQTDEPAIGEPQTGD